jgi:hypothetical protein
MLVHKNKHGRREPARNNERDVVCRKLNIRQKQEERRRAMAEAARQRQSADDGKRRTQTVAVGLAYSPMFQSYRDQ